MKKVAILQSNYIPWKGYFDIIAMVDEFILYDDMQYTRRDWRNRNKIKTPNGAKWLTIPVETKGKFYQKINETQISGGDWAQSHMMSLSQCYSKAPFWKENHSWLQSLYERASHMKMLSDVNYLFITEICKKLGIHTEITWSSDYSLVDGKTERLIGLVQSAGGDFYLSGPAAKDYIVDELFEKASIRLDYMNYEGYPQYPQLHGEFDPYVSILDLILMTGPEARSYMKG